MVVSVKWGLGFHVDWSVDGRKRRRSARGVIWFLLSLTLDVRLFLYLMVLAFTRYWGGGNSERGFDISYLKGYVGLELVYKACCCCCSSFSWASLSLSFQT